MMKKKYVLVLNVRFENRQVEQLAFSFGKKKRK